VTGPDLPRLGPNSHQLRRLVQQPLADVSPQDLVVVACSGGPDSLALAAVTMASGRACAAVIVDHQLQVGSGQIAEQTRRQLHHLGMDAQVVTAQVGTVGGPEGAARQARYEALDVAAQDHKATAVLLGHTRDDQAESVLLGLVRGSGTRSLAGMAARRGHYRRPLLSASRRQIEQSLAELNLEPWNDPTNRDPAFTRSRARHEVMPILEAQLGPGIAKALARTATLARQDADALDLFATDAHRAVVVADWRISALVQLVPAIRTRVLRLEIFAQGGSGATLSAAHIDQVDRLVTVWHGQGPIQLPDRVGAVRRCGRLIIGPIDQIEGPYPSEQTAATFKES